MKAIWKGSLSFGLVSVPVELYSAVQQHALGFTMLHAVCHNPLRYYRWCDHCKKEVTWADTVKGLKLADGSYVILTKEKLKSLKPEKSDQLTLVAYIDADVLEPVYSDQHYYVVPSQHNEKAYYVLQAALAKSGKIILAEGIFKEKNHVCSIQAYKEILLLTTLNFSYEIRAVPHPMGTKAASYTQKELDLAQELLMKWYTKKVDMSKFKDTFAAELMKVVEQQKKGKKTRKIATKEKAPARHAKTSLMDTLKESLVTYAKSKPSSAKRAR